MSKRNKIIGIMGGTFNPIHYGHLRIAEELAQALALDEVRFIPSANPPHKILPDVSAMHRAAMVKLAIADNPKFILDERELMRKGASYTVDTLLSLREELTRETSICLIMGSDAFASLNTWHRWHELLPLCHIVLVHRPSHLFPAHKHEAALADTLQILLKQHYSEHNQDLIDFPAGHITMQAVTALDISATAIRQYLKLDQSVKYLMPEQVIDYMVQHQLYKDDWPSVKAR